MAIKFKIVTVDRFPFAGEQEHRAIALGATHMLRWPRDDRGRGLPQYVMRELSAMGLAAHRVGGTTFSFTVFALVPEQKPAAE